MNHFVALYRPARLIRLGALALAVFAFHPSAVMAQPVSTPATTKPVVKRGGPTPPPSVRSNANLTAPQLAEITRWVTTEAQAMAAGDPAVLSSARGNIVSAAAIPVPNNPNKAPTPASPVYQTTYSTALETALLPQLASKDARVRLNAAVTLAKVAASMNQGTTLVKATKIAVADSAEAVSTWGVRAARDVYPNLLGVNAPEAKLLATAVIAAVRNHPSSPALAEDAYATIAGTNVTGTPARAQAGLDAVMDLIQARAQLYAKATPGLAPEEDPAFPAKPELDAPAATYLAINAWRSMTPGQKAAAGRAIFDQTNELVRLGPLVPPGAPGVPQTRLSDMMKELRNMSSALQVICKAENSPAGVAAAQNLAKLANNTPAQPLMQAEMTKLSEAMTTAKILANPATPPVGAAGAPAALNK